MPLGPYVEIINYVDDPAAAGDTYQKLGLNQTADNVYTDGRYHLRVVNGEGANPALRYYGVDLDAVKARGLTVTDNQLKSPRGVTVELFTEAPPLNLPHSDVMRAPATSRLGKFGEFSTFVHDLPTEQAFWEQCDFATNGVQNEPYNWGIWTDDLMLIGLHERDIDQPFTITHFDPNMKAVNNALKADGFAVQPIPEVEDKNDLSYTTLMTPFGVQFYLFTGDVTPENP